MIITQQHIDHNLLQVVFKYQKVLFVINGKLHKLHKLALLYYK